MNFEVLAGGKNANRQNILLFDVSQPLQTGIFNCVPIQKIPIVSTKVAYCNIVSQTAMLDRCFLMCT